VSVGSLDFNAALRALARHGVDFVVVGGIGAALQSAPITTLDLDVVHSTKPANVARLLAALEEMDAYYRLQPERRHRPNETHLASPGHQLLMTRYGPVDVLGAIGNGRRYEDLLPHAFEMDLGEGVRVRVLNLETLIATKEESGREKDLAALPLLRSALAATRRRK
jgi:predicted nucleotidyltransferase